MKRILSSSLLTIILSCFFGDSFAVSTHLFNNISKKSASNVQVIEEYGNYKFIFWETNSISRVETSQFFLQRVNQNGEFLWKSAILISTIGKYQNSHKFSSDSLGGVYITWEERDSISNNIDVLAQRIDSTGNKLWGSDGKKLALFKSSKISPYVISNGVSGAIFVWSDSRNDLAGNNWDIFAQNLDSSGNNLWSENGIVVSADLKDEFIGKLVKAQNGGIAIVYNKVIQSADKLSSGYEFCFKTINESGQVIQASNFLTLPPSDEHYKLAGDIISKTSDSFIIALTSTNYKNNIPNIHQVSLDSNSSSTLYAMKIDSVDGIKYIANYQLVKDSLRIAFMVDNNLVSDTLISDVKMSNTDLLSTPELVSNVVVDSIPIYQDSSISKELVVSTLMKETEIENSEIDSSGNEPLIANVSTAIPEANSYTLDSIKPPIEQKLAILKTSTPERLDLVDTITTEPTKSVQIAQNGIYSKISQVSLSSLSTQPRIKFVDVDVRQIYTPPSNILNSKLIANKSLTRNYYSIKKFTDQNYLKSHLPDLIPIYFYAKQTQ